MAAKDVSLPAVRVEQALREQLERIVEREGPDTTLSDVVRQALREFAQRRGQS